MLSIFRLPPLRINKHAFGIDSGASERISRRIYGVSGKKSSTSSSRISGRAITISVYTCRVSPDWQRHAHVREHRATNFDARRVNSIREYASVVPRPLCAPERTHICIIIVWKLLTRFCHDASRAHEDCAIPSRARPRNPGASFVDNTSPSHDTSKLQRPRINIRPSRTYTRPARRASRIHPPAASSSA